MAAGYFVSGTANGGIYSLKLFPRGRVDRQQFTVAIRWVIGSWNRRGPAKLLSGGRCRLTRSTTAGDPRL
jgi:hypothetical protein